MKRVQKFRSIEEMNKAAVLVRESQEPPFERFLRHCARYWAIAPRQYPRGVLSSAVLKKHKKPVINTASCHLMTQPRASSRRAQMIQYKSAFDAT